MADTRWPAAVLPQCCGRGRGRGNEINGILTVSTRSFGGHRRDCDRGAVASARDRRRRCAVPARAAVPHSPRCIHEECSVGCGSCGCGGACGGGDVGVRVCGNNGGGGGSSGGRGGGAGPWATADAPVEGAPLLPFARHFGAIHAVTGATWRLHILRAGRMVRIADTVETAARSARWGERGDGAARGLEIRHTGKNTQTKAQTPTGAFYVCTRRGGGRARRMGGGGSWSRGRRHQRWRRWLPRRRQR